MSESQAVDALERLGLSKYEARVFIALQKLGQGTARDVSQISDVPRSQVYGTAENLEARGLIEVQQSNPILYRPIEAEEAKSRLQASFVSDQETAFDYIETVRAKFGDGDEEREDIWTVHGREAIDGRVVRLLRDAKTSVLFAVRDEALLADDVETALIETANEGVEVTVLSQDEQARSRVADAGLTAIEPPAPMRYEERSGRALVVDGDTVLLSVLGEQMLPDAGQETAIWSADTGFAVILVQLIEGWLGSTDGTSAL